MVAAIGFVQLRIGEIDLWRPPFVYSELTGSKNNYTAGDCGVEIESIDLTYKIYITGHCTLAESQEIQRDIEEELKLAPNLTLIRQETPDALLLRNKVKKGSLEVTNDTNELRARFTDNRTLVFTLTLTILPSGDGSGNAVFRHLRYLESTGAFNWSTDDISSLLLDDTSSVPDELYIHNLADFVTFGEITGGSYARQPIADRSVLEGSMVQLLLTDPIFNTTGGAINLVIFQDNGSDATNVPLFLVSFAPLEAGIQTIHVDLLGLV